MSDKILIIDDEKDVCDVLKEALEYEDFEVTVSPAGKQALEAVQKINFEGLIVDLRLEGPVSGVDIIRYFESKSSRPAIMVTSGTPKPFILEIFQREKIEALVDAILEKPAGLNPDTVGKTIRKVLDGRK